MFDAERVIIDGDEYVQAKFYDDAVLGTLVWEDRFIEAAETIDAIDGILYQKGQTEHDQLRKIRMAIGRFKRAS